MDSVICSNLLLSCNYDGFINLAKVNKKFHNTAKIIWEQWVNKNIKTYTLDNLTYNYYNGKNGKRIYHGTFNVDTWDRKKYAIRYFVYSIRPMGTSKEYTLTFKHNKLNGPAFFRFNRKHVIANYKNGCLHGDMKIFSGEKLVSVRFYKNGNKCCSLRNDHRHFCVNHREEGMKLMGWEFEFDEYIGENYQDELFPIEKDYLNIKPSDDTRHVKNVKLCIDRGIRDFVLFGNLLKICFPNLESLTIEQNYSLDEKKNFLTFLKVLCLKEFIINDYRTSFLPLTDHAVDEILSIMPERSEYTFNCGNKLKNISLFYGNKTNYRIITK